MRAAAEGLGAMAMHMHMTGSGVNGEEFNIDLPLRVALQRSNLDMHMYAILLIARLSLCSCMVTSMHHLTRCMQHSTYIYACI